MQLRFAPIIDTMDTPIGGLTLVVDGGRLLMAEFADAKHRIGRWLGGRVKARHSQPVAGEVPDSIERAFGNYFEGDLSAIDDIPVSLGGTPFQNEVWSALRTIRPGETLAYGSFAGRLGRASAARAVGHANGANPLAIVIPCHRLFAADGALTNYGGGLERKRWLLDHEQRHASA
jgi:methylated-DNA-[protein]-cysteine S-methyltransferase